MPKVTVAQPFVWRDGHKAVLIEKGEQPLTPEQLAHAEKYGFLQVAKPASSAKKTPLEEKNNEQ